MPRSKDDVHGVFFETYKTTVAVDFKLKRLTVNGTKVRLQLWDIMGQERFKELVRVSSKEAIGRELRIVIYFISPGLLRQYSWSVHRV